MKKWEIHITELSGCKRKWEYSILNYPKSIPHVTPLRGTILHSVLEQIIRYNRYNLDKEEVLKDISDEVPDKLYETALNQSKDLIDRAQQWVSETTLNIDKVKSETKITRRYRGIAVTGQIDLYNRNLIIDFKSSKKVMRKSFLTQLAGYSWLLSEDRRKKKRERYLVFFGGGDDVTEVKLTESQIEQGDNLFRDNLVNATSIAKELIDTYSNKSEHDKFITECKVSQLCAYCPYRGICTGA